MISVIIPVYNGAQTLPACLQALRNQTCPPDEVIVIDDGSTDGTSAVAARFRVKVLLQANAGPAAARNYGVQIAQGDPLLFTDADCIPAPDWVENMVTAFADPNTVGVKGEYRTNQPELVARFVQQEYQERYDRMAGQDQIDFVDTYSAGYRRSIFLAAGGFDVTFPTASVEDQEFSFRLAQQGYRLKYAPGVIVYHRHDQRLWEYARRKYWIGYWKALVMRRYPAKLARDSHTPQMLKIQMGLAALSGLLLLGGASLQSGITVMAGGLACLLLWATALPFYIKLWRRDRAVLLIAPLLLWVRAWALGLGFLLGTLRFLYWQPFQRGYENYKL
jgi:glycosyltransferase involved in cell wall biosynthesis